MSICQWLTARSWRVRRTLTCGRFAARELMNDQSTTAEPVDVLSTAAS